MIIRQAWEKQRSHGFDEDVDPRGLFDFLFYMWRP